LFKRVILSPSVLQNKIQPCQIKILGSGPTTVNAKIHKHVYVIVDAIEEKARYYRSLLRSTASKLQMERWGQITFYFYFLAPKT